MWRYEVWFDGNCLYEENGFESEEEACDEADEYVADKIKEWKTDGCYDGETPADFNIVVKYN